MRAGVRRADPYMEDPGTFWIVVANLALGAVSVACVLTVLFGILCGVVSQKIRRNRQLAEIVRELERLFAEADRRL